MQVRHYNHASSDCGLVLNIRSTIAFAINSYSLKVLKSP